MPWLWQGTLGRVTKFPHAPVYSSGTEAVMQNQLVDRSQMLGQILASGQHPASAGYLSHSLNPILLLPSCVALAPLPQSCARMR